MKLTLAILFVFTSLAALAPRPAEAQRSKKRSIPIVRHDRSGKTPVTRFRQLSIPNNNAGKIDLVLANFETEFLAVGDESVTPQGRFKVTVLNMGKKPSQEAWLEVWIWENRKFKIPGAEDQLEKQMNQMLENLTGKTVPGKQDENKPVPVFGDARTIPPLAGGGTFSVEFDLREQDKSDLWFTKFLNDQFGAKSISWIECIISPPPPLIK